MAHKILTKPAARLSALFFACALGACNTIENAPLHLNYDIGRIEPGVKITLTMRGDLDGETELKIGDAWADEKSPHERFKSIEVSGGVLTRENAHVNIRHEANANLTISWELHKTDGRNFQQDPIYFFAPVITDNYIHLIGYTSLMFPVTKAPVSINFAGSALAGESQAVLSPLWSSPAPIDGGQIPSGFLMAGKINARRSADEKIAVGIAPGLELNSAKLIKDLEPVLSSLSQVWGSEATSYSVTLQPAPPEIGTVLAGTAFAGGFAAAASSDMGGDRLGGFLTHEVAHEWVPNKIGALEFEATSREPEGYWISEGFTQLLSRKAQIQSGQLDDQGYADRVNEDLRELYLSPVRTHTNAQIGEKFWTDRDIERLPYLRGFLVAAKWDAEIARHSKGIADMIDVLKSLERANNVTEDGIKLTKEIVIEHAKMQGALNPELDVSGFIIAGNLFTPPDNMLGPDFVLSEVKVHPYDIGFDFEKTRANGIVEGVLEGSNAYRAGLRNGIGFVSKLSGGGGDTTVPIVLKLSDQGQEFELSYIPAEPDGVMVPQFIRK